MIKNDWIVAGLNNPEFTPYDFSTIAELTLDNTQMLSADEYLKSNFIKNHDLFKDDSGNFSENKFKQYHQKRLNDFREFQEQEFPKGPQLDMFDTDKTKESRIKDIRFELGRHVNPDRQAVGIEGVRVWSNPTQTKSEIAQSQNIWDTKNQKFKDYSSNDKALSNGLFDWLGQIFSDPLVMAQWEEDGEHIDPITGLVTKHRKGDYKLNDKGTYYYETLGDRNPIGKEVLSVFDTLTVDGEGINKYDFFDSDDVKKSISGVIAKNVVKLLPLFTPAGGVYSTLMIAKEFSKAMPMLYGWMTSLSDIQEAPNWINKVAVYGTKFSGGTSQYAKENTFSFENFGNLIADVALQWGQQKAIANGINKLRSSNNYIDDAMKSAKSLYDTKKVTLGESEELWQICMNKYLPEAQKMATQASNLGRDASLAYMAIISNSDLYNEMRNMGLTNSEAAAISLGSTLGMFGLNKYTGLGEIFFDDATDDSVKLARKAIKEEMKSASEMFKKIKNSDLPQPNKMLKFIQTASEKTKKVFDQFSEDLKYHTLNFAGKAVGEGLEEVSEELISDVAKEIYQLAGQFGFDTTLKDIGAWDNALERYTMSFLGGAIGGGIFYGKEAFVDGKSYKRDFKDQEMATLIRNGHANELRNEVEKLKKNGKIGSTTLSASKYEKNDKDEYVWLTTENKSESQNDAIANAMLEKINALEAVINNNRIGLSDEQLFENMVLTEKRYKQYEKIAPLTNYYQDFNNIINDLIAAELDFKKASTTIEGTVNGTPRTDIKLTPEQEAVRQQQLLPLQQRVEDLRKKKDEFLAGDTSLEYTRKLNFLIDPMLHSQFLSIDQNQFFKEKYGDRKPEELNLEELINFQTEWNKKVENTLKNEVDKSWKKFKEKEALIIPELQKLESETKEYKKFISETESLFNGILDLDKLSESYVNWDSKLDDESDEDFNLKNKKIIKPTQFIDESGNTITEDIEESDYEFQTRQLQRIRKIEAYNQQIDQKWVDEVNKHLAKVNYKVDPITFRYLKKILPQKNKGIPERQRDVLDRKLALTEISLDIRNIFKRLKYDLSNIDEVKSLIQENTKQEVIQLLQKPITFNLIDVDGEELDIYDYINTSEDGDLTLKEIQENPNILDIKNEDFINSLISLIPIVGENVTLSDVIQMRESLEQSEEANNYIKQKSSIYENSLETLISEVKNNPIYNFVSQLKTQIKNPIGELIKSLSKKNGDEISNVDELLNLIQDEFEGIEDVNQLILDDTQMNNLEKIKNYMKLIDGIMYAASSNPDKNNPVGHNQVINSFAEAHKDKLIKEWNPLPEIDSDYYSLYSRSMSQYSSEIDWWIRLSNDNSVNKIKKFIATDKAFNESLYNIIKSKNLKFKLDDEEFDLLEGLVENESEIEIKLFNIEQLIHNNFQKFLKKSKLSITEFLNKTNLLEKLIPSVKNISKQQVAKLNDTLKKEDLTDFDLIQYFAQIFTLNPSLFYSELKTKVTKNEDTAPITSQEYSTKLAKAITYQQYRDIINYAYEKSESKLPYLSNTLIISGVAGSGKTSVVLSAVNNPDEEVLVAGPTIDQASKLADSLKRTKFDTFKNILTNLLGEKQLSDITTEFNKIKNGNTIKTHDSKYFTSYPVNGHVIIKLKPNVIDFNTLEKIPKKIFLDEATHLSSLELQILNEYAKKTNGVIYAAGDPNQRGYINKQSKITNLEEISVFSSRTPRLSISLRDNNLQKYQNQELVRTLLDEINDDYSNLSEEELNKVWPRAINTISKFNFKVYNHDVLNGDLITKDLSPELINKLKSSKSIGFIGDENSPYLQKLKESGIKPSVYSMDGMQGQEFDFVIIDQNWKKPNQNYDVKLFLTDLYTTMTRATTASIFIDNGLSDIIGKNISTNNKSKAPSILSGVKELREKKLNILNQLKLDLKEIKDEDKKEDKKENPIIKNPDEDFINPDDKNIDKDLIEIISQNNIEENKQFDNNLNFSQDLEQVVETFTDITIIGAEVLEHQTRIINNNGKDIELKDIPVWKIKHPSEGPLRNLQVFYEDGSEIITYGNKLEAQKVLFDIKSSIIFQHSWDDIKSLQLKKFFTKQKWDEGKLELEIREPDASDNTHLNAHYSESGIIHNKKPYIVNIVFKVETIDGKEVKFDISGLPSIDYYHSQLPEIQKNLLERIKKTKNDSEKAILQEKHDKVNFTFNNYKTLLDQLINDYENDKQNKQAKFKSIPIDQSCLEFNRTTWFQKLSDSDKKQKLQLGGKLNPITGDYSKDSLELRHPELVFSQIYTYANKNNKFEEIDQSLKGKAVVFVTSDTLLRPDELIHIYQEQKNNPNINKASVRMLVLNNYGMTFSQFIDPKFITSFQEGTEERKPFRQNYNGIRMFTSLWNWRAGLMKFNKTFGSWQSEQGYTDSQIKVLTEVDQLRYDASVSDKSSEKTKLEKQANLLLKKSNLTEDDMQKLHEFNTKGLENVPIFRLGYSKNNNGFYIRGNVDVSSSSLYNKDKVNLVAITPEKAIQFEKLINRILSAIEYTEEFGHDSLGLRLLKEDKSKWDVEELIDLSPNSEHRRVLSNLLSDDNGKLKLSANGVEIAYADGTQWSMIPAVISNIVRTITYFQHNESELNNVEKQCAKIKITEHNGEVKEKRLMETQIGDLFLSGDIKFGNDDSLFDLLNLVFHGTTDDIHKTLKKGTSLLQAEDAYFKQGFFINPDISRSSARQGDPEIVRITGYDDEVLFYEIATSKELFTVDTNVRTSGVGLKINEIYKQLHNQKEEVKTSENQENSEDLENLENDEDKFKKEYKSLSDIIESGINVGKDFKYNLESAKDAITWYNKNLLSDIKNSIQRKNSEILSEPYEVKLDNDNNFIEINFQTYILQNIEENEIDNITFNDNKLFIEAGNSEYYIDQSLEVKKTTNVIETENSINPADVKISEDSKDVKTSEENKIILSNNKPLDSFLLNYIEKEKNNIINFYENDILGSIKDEDLDRLTIELINIFTGEKTQEKISELLTNLDNDFNSVYGRLLDYLEIHDEEIYKEIAVICR